MILDENFSNVILLAISTICVMILVIFVDSRVYEGFL
jgi:hypothetical protein